MEMQKVCALDGLLAHAKRLFGKKVVRVFELKKWRNILSLKFFSQFSTTSINQKASPRSWVQTIRRTAENGARWARRNRRSSNYRDQSNARLDHGLPENRKVPNGLEVHPSISEVQKVWHRKCTRNPRTLFGLPWRTLRRWLVLQVGLFQAQHQRLNRPWTHNYSSQTRCCWQKSFIHSTRCCRSEHSHNRKWSNDSDDAVLRGAFGRRGKSNSRA